MGETNGKEVFQFRKGSVKAHCKHCDLLTSLPVQGVLVEQLTFRLQDPSQSPFAFFWTSHIPGIAKVYLEKANGCSQCCYSFTLQQQEQSCQQLFECSKKPKRMVCPV